jgi:hypothetical protein
LSAALHSYRPSDGGVTPHARTMLREAADQLAPQADAIARTMLATYEAEIPTYREIGDASLLEDVHAVSAAMVRLWLTVMATGHPVDERLLLPLVEGARRRAAQGIDMESMLRAYRIGIRVMWSEIIASPTARTRMQENVVGAVATWALEFADRISTAVAAAYLDEATHVAREREHRRSSLLNVILSGPGAEQRPAPEDLDAPHCVVLARLDANPALAELEATGRRLETDLRALLWTVRHCSVVAVVPLSASSDRMQLHRSLSTLAAGSAVSAFGVGARAEGAGQTRASYVEAVDALRIGGRLGAVGGPVYDHSEMAPLIGLLGDENRARRFAATALDPLAPLLERRWALPTIEAYLMRQGRLKEIAAVLGVHPNTVKYRLAELRPVLDRTVGDGDYAATLLLAVRVHQYFTTPTPCPHGPRTSFDSQE